MYKTILGAVLAFGISMNASALMISSGVDVGIADQFLGDRKQNQGQGGSSPKAELAWINNLLESDTHYTVRTKDVEYFATSDENVFAFELEASPAYYVIKNATYWALYANTGNLDWGVFDVRDFHGGFNLPKFDDMEISHVTEFGTGVTPVPVPASLPLLLAALAGFGWFRRRKARNA